MSFQTFKTFIFETQVKYVNAIYVQHAFYLLNVNNADYVQQKRAHAERKQCSLRWLPSGILSKMAEDGNSAEIMLLLFSLRTKSILIAS